MIASILLVASTVSASTSWNDLSLRRAVALWQSEDAARALDVLETPQYGGSDSRDARAEFLRVYALHARGERVEFIDEARTLLEWEDAPEWVRVLAPLAGLDADPAGIDPSTMPGPVAAEPLPPSARDQLREDGLGALADGRWADAYRGLSEAEQEWLAEGDTLERLDAAAARQDVGDVWEAWATAGRRPDGRAMDRRLLEEAARETLAEVLDLTREPGTRTPRLADTNVVVASSPSLLSRLERPGAESMRSVARAEEAVAVARTDHRRAERQLEDAIARASRRVRYYELGAERAAGELAAATEAKARADSLLARSDVLAARVAAIRDDELQRIASRTARLAERTRRNRLAARALRHFRAEGPGTAGPIPVGIPSPTQLLDADVILANHLERWSVAFAESAADLVTRSHDQVWRPRVVNGPLRIAKAAAFRARRAREALAAIDRAASYAAAPARLAEARLRVAQANGILSERMAARDDLRVGFAREAIAAAMSKHAAEGEAITYALAVASLESGLVEGDTPTGVALRQESAARCETFLQDFAASPARSEVRFRLADARLRTARDAFREQVAAFVGREPTAEDWGRTELAPFLDSSAALQPYLDILEEDPQWVHRDAVLFEAGMILSDEADARGGQFLTELVERFPSSRHAARAHLRLGDARFDEGDWAACVPHFEKAVQSADPERAAIALYKIAWATFAQDQFEESARTSLRLMDHYEAYPDAAARTDLRDEGSDHLVHSLARAGGAASFARLFDPASPRPHEKQTLDDLGRLLRGFSLFEEAAACDSLWLARWPLDADALDAAVRLAESRARADGPEAALAARLAVAERFQAGSAWSVAQTDSVSAVGDSFARNAHHAMALQRHRLARETGEAADWQATLAAYDTLLGAWGQHDEAGAYHTAAGEAASVLKDHARAVAHFDAAARSVDPKLATEAAWHGVVARDAWYESTRSVATADSSEAPGDSTRARALLASIDSFAEAHSADERLADLRWRQGSLAYEHGWRDDAAAALGRFTELAPKHESALAGTQLQGQALYELERFAEAGRVWTVAASLARSSGADSLATDLEQRLPHCGFREAEVRLAGEGRRAAPDAAALFDSTATRWPGWEHADRALYRAGLAWEAGQRPSDAVHSWTRLGEQYPDSDYARDALVKIAETWEQEKRPTDAADAYLRLSRAFPEDADAATTLLTAVDLLASAGATAGADSARDEYLARFPEDAETALSILEPRAKQELRRVSVDHPISGWLTTPKAAAPTSLVRYLELATRHDSLASPALLAEVRYQRGEEIRQEYVQAKLSQPLEPSIARKTSFLENILEEYRACSAYGAAPWNRAAAFRIGESLVAFGDALIESERPGDLSGDDLLAYDEILENRSWEFWDRGEETWTALVRQAPTEGDEWVERALQELWPRVAKRLVHRPEVEVPLVHAMVPSESAEGTQ